MGYSVPRSTRGAPASSQFHRQARARVVSPTLWQKGTSNETSWRPGPGWARLLHASRARARPAAPYTARERASEHGAYSCAPRAPPYLCIPMAEGKENESRERRRTIRCRRGRRRVLANRANRRPSSVEPGGDRQLKKTRPGWKEAIGSRGLVFLSHRACLSVYRETVGTAQKGTPSEVRERERRKWRINGLRSARGRSRSPRDRSGEHEEREREARKVRRLREARELAK